ncbi:MAG: hypothetical protein ACE144_07140 [Thermodesulfobacteriota bacterium]
MLKGAICFFAFAILLFGCASKTALPPLPPPPPTPESIPDPTLSETALNEGGIGPVKKPEERAAVDKEKKVEEVSKEEVQKEVEAEVAHLTPASPPKVEVPESLPLLPDLAMTSLFLNPKKRLSITIANIGKSPVPIGLGHLKIFLDGQLKGSYRLDKLSDQSILQPNEDITFATPLTIRGRREVKAFIEPPQEIKETNQENNYLDRVLEGLPIGPDIAIKDLDLTEDFDLFIVLSNAGEVDLRKGATFHIRVFVNNLRISVFDHFTSEIVKADFGNDYTIFPPHRVGIPSTARVKIVISSRLSSDDLSLENNRLEKTFIIFPLRMVALEKKEFSFSVPSPLKENGPPDKLRTELRWDGGEPSLLFSLSRPEQGRNIPTFSGKSPIRVEFPIYFDEGEKEHQWKAYVTNLLEKRVEGHLIIQHP